MIPLSNKEIRKQRLANLRTQKCLEGKYKKEFEACRELLELTWKTMDDCQFPIGNPLKAAALPLFVKGFNLLWAIWILCKQGFAVEASILLRTLFNTLVVFRYLGEDKTGKRARKYAEFETVARKNQLDLLQRLGKLKGKKLVKLRNEIEPMYKWIKTKYGLKKEPKSEDWKSDKIKDMANKVGLLEDYEYLYGPQLSELEHSGPGSIQKYLEMNPGDDRPKLFSGPQDKEGELKAVMFTSCNYFLKMFEKVSGIFGLNLSSELQKQNHRLRKIFA